MMAFPEDFLLDRLIYRDGLMLVINKPAGLAVHAGPSARKTGGGDNLENYFDALRFGLPRPPALAHRLDRDTSGCLVLGRHPKALRKLGKLFSEGKIEKTYWAVCKGAPEKPSGRIEAPLKKQSRGNGWRVEIADDGKPAATTYRTLAQKDGLSFIEAKPKTGRTHQIRVHLASIGSPIVGDPQYGGLNDTERSHPMMLHARRIIIPISKNKDPIVVEAEPPDEMAEVLVNMGSLPVATP
ncbi:MAG: RNA pseudouridine synthase [Hyphococcus sp.]|nr:MAG: RNA pseudouridine synthase [Marinicaulis sp.]